MSRKIGSEKKQATLAALRRKIVVVTILIVLLSIAAVLLFSFTLFRSPHSPEPSQRSAPPAAASVLPMSSPAVPPTARPSASASAAESEPTVVKIMLTGDLMCLYGQQSAAKNGDGYDFHPSFSLVSRLFSDADYVAGNLETTVNAAVPLTAPSQTSSAAEGEAAVRTMPVLNAPESYLEALANAGFDFVSTVNNHCCDTGTEGIIRTIEALDAHALAHTGTFLDAGSSRFFLADINGVRVAFLAYSEFFNGKDGGLTQEERSSMLGVFSEESAVRDIHAARQAGAEFVIVYTHWGDENHPSPNETQTAHAQILADAGADVIAGSHPHCLQPAEYLQAADGRSVLCLYSLGNFVSSMAQQIHNDTVIAELTLVRDAGGTVRLESAGYVPCKVFPSYQGDPFVVVPLPADGPEELEAVRARIEERMGAALSPIDFKNRRPQTGAAAAF